MPEFSFPSKFEVRPNIGFYRLPTHKHGVHWNFFSIIPLYFKNEILAIRCIDATLGTNGLTSFEVASFLV